MRIYAYMYVMCMSVCGIAHLNKIRYAFLALKNVYGKINSDGGESASSWRRNLGVRAAKASSKQKEKKSAAIWRKRRKYKYTKQNNNNC